VGDVVKPWAHVAIVVATRYPSYFDLNVEPGERLIRERDECFDAHAHRRGYFDLVDAAEPLRVGFEACRRRADRAAAVAPASRPQRASRGRQGRRSLVARSAGPTASSRALER
jgi:hypothetical protein